MSQTRMTAHNPLKHISAELQSRRRSSYFPDLGNGNFLDSLPSPATNDTANASVLPHKEYHGAFKNSARPAGTRRYTVSIAPRPKHCPSSWSEVPKPHNYTRSNNNDSPSHSSSDDDQTGVESITSPTGSPLQHLGINQSPDSMLYSSTQLFAKPHGCVDRPMQFSPRVHCKPKDCPSLPSLIVFKDISTTMNFQLHPYLSSPPFSHSFRDHAETIYRLGFVKLNDYATTPPTSIMNIRSPFLPWSIELCRAHYLTVYDVLCAIFELLHEAPTRAEINILYHSSGAKKKKYRKVTAACRNRLTQGNAYQPSDKYIRKIDWLSGKHVFDGLAGRNDEEGFYWRLCLRL